MNYLKIKKKLNNILPKFIFNFIIYIWRNSFIKFNNFIKNNKLINFDKEIFKKIKINNISYLLKLNPNNGFIDKKIYTNGIYEKEIYTLMYKNISKNYICVDIGANIGMYTNFLPKLIGKKGKVIGFEPIKSIYKQNNESIKKNGYINVKLYNYACSDKEEDIIININDENIGGSSLIYNNKHNRQESIKSIIGDSILLKEAKIDFIKIDTEGHELNVLNGIIKTIEKFKPKIIIEFSPYLFINKNEGKKILKLLKSFYNYVYVIEYKKELNLKNKKDLKEYNNLINEQQVNIYLK